MDSLCFVMYLLLNVSKNNLAAVRGNDKINVCLNLNAAAILSLS